MSISYSTITSFADTVEATRCAKQLLVLREQLRPIREKNTQDSLMLATWNIRDFGAVGKFGSPGRHDESLMYLAEIISAFDLVAIQEVSGDLEEFHRLLAILGSSEWDYLVTDVTEGRGGNGERMAFIYNRTKVEFEKVAGEIVLPSGQLIVPPPAKDAAEADAGDEKSAAEVQGQQFARTPFLVAFRAGWFHFNLCTVHIYYGSTSGPKFARRIEEIRRLVNFFANRQDREVDHERDRAVERARRDGVPSPEDAKPLPQDLPNYLLLGDFNVEGFEDATMDALERRGFRVPDQIRDAVDTEGLPAVKRPHFYDQIAVRARDTRFRVTDGGSVDIFASVFTDDQVDLYIDQVPQTDEGDDDDNELTAVTPLDLYRKWRTWQMSDHWPLWIRIQTDFSNDYLESLETTTPGG